MRIQIERCRLEIRFIARGGGLVERGEITFTEIGGYDASPTGISYVWPFEPNSIDALIAALQRVKTEHEEWARRFLIDLAGLEP